MTSIPVTVITGTLGAVPPPLRRNRQRPYRRGGVRDEQRLPLLHLIETSDLAARARLDAG